jgi:hypothetical protein
MPNDEPAFRWFKVGLLILDDVLDAGSRELFDDIKSSAEMTGAALA